MLSDPKSEWTAPGITTYRFKNHAVRTEGWRFIRYENGDEELYDETADPNEWTNLATDPKHAAKKAELTKLLPDHNQPDIGSKKIEGAVESGDGKNAKKKQMKKEAGK